MENTTQAPTSDAQGSADQSPITLTDKAVQMVKITREQEGIEADYGLRVAVRGGGCSGMEYALDFEREPRENDFVISYEGLEVYVDGISARYLQGTEIDYILGSTGAGFKFNNPNATGSCGCGSSFSV